MSLVVAAIALLLHTPVFDPLAWSAANQYRRVAEQRVAVEAFDFAALRFKLGEVGYEKLQLLNAMESHPQAALVREKVKAVEDATSYQSPQATSLIVRAEHLQTIGLPEALPAGLVDVLNSDLSEYIVQGCATQRDCAVFPVTLDPTLGPAYALLPSGGYAHTIYVYRRGSDEHSWRRQGAFSFIGCYGPVLSDRAAIVEALRRGEIHRAVPLLPNLKIADWEFSPKPDC
jgi:hypothetical protein